MPLRRQRRRRVDVVCGRRWQRLVRAVARRRQRQTVRALQLALVVARCPHTTRSSRHMCDLATKHNTHLFNGPFSGTTQVSRYQKGKTNLDFTEARDSEWHWRHLASSLKSIYLSIYLGHMQVCKSASRSRQTTTPTPHHSSFYRPDALPAAQPTVSKH